MKIKFIVFANLLMFFLSVLVLINAVSNDNLVQIIFASAGCLIFLTFVTLLIMTAKLNQKK